MRSTRDVVRCSPSRDGVVSLALPLAPVRLVHHEARQRGARSGVAAPPWVACDDLTPAGNRERVLGVRSRNPRGRAALQREMGAHVLLDGRAHGSTSLPRPHQVFEAHPIAGGLVQAATMTSAPGKLLIQQHLAEDLSEAFLGEFARFAARGHGNPRVRRVAHDRDSYRPTDQVHAPAEPNSA